MGRFCGHLKVACVCVCLMGGVGTAFAEGDATATATPAPEGPSTAAKEEARVEPTALLDVLESNGLLGVRAKEDTPESIRSRFTKDPVQTAARRHHCEDEAVMCFRADGSFVFDRGLDGTPRRRLLPGESLQVVVFAAPGETMPENVTLTVQKQINAVTRKGSDTETKALGTAAISGAAEATVAIANKLLGETRVTDVTTKTFSVSVPNNPDGLYGVLRVGTGPSWRLRIDPGRYFVDFGVMFAAVPGGDRKWSSCSPTDKACKPTFLNKDSLAMMSPKFAMTIFPAGKLVGGTSAWWDEAGFGKLGHSLGFVVALSPETTAAPDPAYFGGLVELVSGIAVTGGATVTSLVREEGVANDDRAWGVKPFVGLAISSELFKLWQNAANAAEGDGATQDD